MNDSETEVIPVGTVESKDESCLRYFFSDTLQF